MKEGSIPPKEKKTISKKYDSCAVEFIYLYAEVRQLTHFGSSNGTMDIIRL